jgi:hypothetical protein
MVEFIKNDQRFSELDLNEIFDYYSGLQRRQNFKNSP